MADDRVVTGEGLPLLVFDGDCGFCSSSARWVARRWRRPARAVPWQRLSDVDLDRLGPAAAELAAAAWWVDEEGRAWRGHLAVARALAATGGGWRVVGRLLLRPPLRWVASPVYRLVTRYRYRLPGGTPACRADGPG